MARPVYRWKDVLREALTSFGRGIHHCLGALLARLEGRIVFEMLLKRLAKIDLLGEQTKFRTSVVFRGLHSLPLRCARA